MAVRSRGTDHESEERAGRGEPLSTKEVAGLLNRADIVLTHGGGIASLAIRWFTHSYWNHAAIVFVLEDKAARAHEGYQKTFILEAESQGVDIHPIDKYLYNEKQDMMILRFPSSSLPPDRRRVDFLRRVRGFGVEEIDAKYSYPVILRIAQRLSGPLGWFFITPMYRFLSVATRLNHKKAINAFVCSGVVQHAYYRAAYGEEPSTGSFWDTFFEAEKNRHALIVSPKARAKFSAEASFESVDDELGLTTPADFARALDLEDGVLECVAERVKGDWKTKATKL
jgi:hypothetical protein